MGGEMVGVIGCPELTPRGKLSLLVAKARYHSGGLKQDAVVDCGVARIRFGRESFAFDWYVFEEVFFNRIYEGLRLERASVLDLGAHKGYFAVFALRHGAATVVSFEPEPTNFQRLEAAADGVHEWTVRREAVGGKAGVGTLGLRDAWSHSLIRQGEGDDALAVPVTALQDVLSTYAGERIVVKVDIEGAECEALAQTPAELLARVEEMVVEVHADAPCRAADIVATAQEAGLRGVAIDLNHSAPLLHFRGGDERKPGAGTN